MTNFEMVELLREKANVSYEEAKLALEASNWDLLDAMLLLEQEGKVPKGAERYSTEAEEEKSSEKEDRGDRNIFRQLRNGLVKALRIGNKNYFVIKRQNEEVLSLPITVCVILLLTGIGELLLVALAVGLFCGVRYSFRGPNFGKDSINDAMDKAADAAESVKQSVRNGGE